MSRHSSLSKVLLSSLEVAVLSLAMAGAVRADVMVAADGSGQYKTVQEAVAAAPSGAPVTRLEPGTTLEL